MILAFPGFAFAGCLPQAGGKIQKELGEDSDIFPYLVWVKLELFLTLPDTSVSVSVAACYICVYVHLINVKF